MIAFRCPGCPAVYTVDDDRAWQTDSCPKCRQEFTMPGDPPAEAYSGVSETRAETPAPPIPRLPRQTPKRNPEKIASKRIVAGVLALFFGAFGVHKFVL